MPAPRLALGLSGRHLQALAADRALLARLDAAPVVFALAGVDRIDGTGRLRTTTLDSSATAAVLTARTSYAAFLVAAAPQRDHPYNLARRIDSLDLLSGERSGLALGITDGFAPAGPPGQEAWGGAGLSPGAPLGPATTRD